MNPKNKPQTDLFGAPDDQANLKTDVGPIGVFDSGLGGLTVLRQLHLRLPQYDYLYLGDQARVPYGTRSFETVLRYTREGVSELFSRGCTLVILACNTASAKALRSLQQQWLPDVAPDRRILGVLRPSTEEAGNFTRNGHLGILATPGTVLSDSYPKEIGRFFPNVHVTQRACPLWVPLVEAGELDSEGTRYFVSRDLQCLFQSDPKIDAVLLACTHYPLLRGILERVVGPGVKLVDSSEACAEALKTTEGSRKEKGELKIFLTDEPGPFLGRVESFLGKGVVASVERIHLPHG